MVNHVKRTTDYLDNTHQESELSKEKIRRWCEALQEDISKWEPKPCPKNWTPQANKVWSI